MTGEAPTLSLQDNLALISLENIQMQLFIGAIMGTIAFAAAIQLLQEVAQDMFNIRQGGNGLGSRDRVPEVEIT